MFVSFGPYQVTVHQATLQSSPTLFCFILFFFVTGKRGNILSRHLLTFTEAIHGNTKTSTVCMRSHPVPSRKASAAGGHVDMRARVYALCARQETLPEHERSLHRCRTVALLRTRGFPASMHTYTREGTERKKRAVQVYRARHCRLRFRHCDWRRQTVTGIFMRSGVRARSLAAPRRRKRR